MNKKSAVIFWSGGKDSALALYRVLNSGAYEVKYLVTTVNKNFKRISMHGIREELLQKQAKETGLDLIKMYVEEGTNKEYEEILLGHFAEFKKQGIDFVIYGDIFLGDLRKYRDALMEKAGLKGVYPLWKENTKKLINQFLELKFRTITCCVNDAFLDEKWVGREVDEKFIAELRVNVDACGENGEFHTFCFAGPVFKEEIKFKAGEKIYKPLEIKTTDCNLPESKTQGFWFCDLE